MNFSSSLSLLNSVLIATSHNVLPYFLFRSMTFLTPLGTWIPNFYLMQVGFANNLSILAYSTSDFALNIYIGDKRVFYSKEIVIPCKQWKRGMITKI
jgi:hypothetical protein